MEDPQTASSFTPFLRASSTAQATDTSASGVVYAALASNTTTATFATVGSGIVTFAGTASASAPQPGLAQAQSSEYFQYNFTVTGTEAFALDLSYSSRTLGCCGNQVSLLNLGTGYVFSHNNYNADNSFSYAGTLQASAYRLFVTKSEYYRYDAPSFNGTSGASNVTHNDRVTFTIGTPAVTGSVPEPATWATMIAGFALAGGAMRRRRKVPALA